MGRVEAGNAERQGRRAKHFQFQATSLSNLFGISRLRSILRFLEVARDPNKSLECTEVLLVVSCIVEEALGYGSASFRFANS